MDKETLDTVVAEIKAVEEEALALVEREEFKDRYSYVNATIADINIEVNHIVLPEFTRGVENPFDKEHVQRKLYHVYKQGRDQLERFIKEMHYMQDLEYEPKEPSITSTDYNERLSWKMMGSGVTKDEFDGSPNHLFVGYIAHNENGLAKSILLGVGNTVESVLKRANLTPDMVKLVEKIEIGNDNAILYRKMWVQRFAPDPIVIEEIPAITK